MTNEQILKKAIEKAKNNGYNYDYGDLVIDTTRNIIFSHSFAKAFWGSEEKEMIITSEMSKTLDQEYKTGIKRPLWEWELQRMVLEPEPLKYLEKFL